MIYPNNSPSNKKRKKSKLEKGVKKEGRKSLRKVLKGKVKGHFVPSKRKETDYENIAKRKALKRQQNIADKSTNPKQEAAVQAALKSMIPKEKPFMATGSSRDTKWAYSKKKKKYRAVKGN